MPGSVMVSLDGAPLNAAMKEAARKGANPSGRLASAVITGGNWAINSGHSDQCLLGNSRVYEDDRFAGCFIGALIDRTVIPWSDILHGLENGDDTVFRSFHANFGIIVHDKTNQATYLVSDKFGQHPLYAGFADGHFLASSSLLTFLHAQERPKVNPKWLHDFFFFNYPLGTTSLLDGVERIGPGRVVRMDIRSGQKEERRYAPQLEKIANDMSVGEAQELALQTFDERFPRYYDNIAPGGCGVGVTGGFDARIVASYMPEGVRSTLYTYGIDGCADMINGKQVADKLGLSHYAFPLGSMGAEELRSLALDTIYYSGGNLNALRSTLAKVYQHLTGKGLGNILTGVSSGHFFRGVFSTPQVLSAGLVELIQNPDHQPAGIYKTLFRDSDSFYDTIEKKRHYLKESLGWQDRGVEERHMSFMHYEQAPKYFGGELAFVESFGHMRSPFWDSHIRELSFRIPLSTLHNSSLSAVRVPPWETKAMLGYILSNGPLRHLTVDGMPPKYWAAGNWYGFYAGKVLYKSKAKLSHLLNPKAIPLENWEEWVKDAFVPLLSDFENSPLSQYIKPETVAGLLKEDTSEPMVLHWIGKLFSASLILDLVGKRLPHFSS